MGGEEKKGPGHSGEETNENERETALSGVSPPPRLGPPQRRADLAVWQIPLVPGSLGSYNSHKGEKRKRPRRGGGDTIIVARKVYTQKREQGRRGGGSGLGGEFSVIRKGERELPRKWQRLGTN